MIEEGMRERYGERDTERERESKWAYKSYHKIERIVQIITCNLRFTLSKITIFMDLKPQNINNQSVPYPYLHHVFDMDRLINSLHINEAPQAKC